MMVATLAQMQIPKWSEIGMLYLQTFGWAIVGTLSMGIALIVTLKLFTLSTVSVDEWKEIKEGNMSMGIVLASVIVALAIVVRGVIGG